MGIGDAVDKSCQTGTSHPFDDFGEGSPRTGDPAETSSRCAYNKTRGYILGVEIDCGDFSFASLAGRLPMLTPKSGAGLWMVPFKGIPTASVPVPLDLLYLDADCRVIEAVEFFPTFRVSPSSPPAASLLALPVHSVFASHSQPGDQIAFGLFEEVEHELAQLFGPNASASAVQDAIGVLDKPVPSPVAAPVQEEHPFQAEPPAVQPAVTLPVAEPAQPEPWKKETGKPKSWLQKLLHPEPPEPRKASRAALPGLIAHFWTGGAPQAHPIRDISSTGLYVLTEERWYPGTMIQMTLKKTGSGGAKTDFSISLMAKSSRWGNDGVGLEFVVRDPRKPLSAQVEGVDREQLDRFLERLKPENS